MSRIDPKHHPELIQRAARGDYSRTPEGLLIRKADVLVTGRYTHSVNGGDVQEDPNLVPDEGLHYLLEVAFGTRPKAGAWYLALYSGQVTPQASWTAANFAQTAAEITSDAEGYTEASRVAFAAASAQANQLTNYDSKARFTFASASSVAVEGVALLSVATKGATSGLLASASRFAQPRVMYNSDTLDIGYGIALAS